MTGQAEGRVRARLAELGIDLPQAATPVGSYVPAIIDGDHVLTSGQLPVVTGALPQTGLVGREVTPEDAQSLARISAINAIAAIAGALDGDLDRVEQITKVVGFVASTPDFTGQPAVVNGASDLLAEVFGDQGVHARSAVGVAALPLGAPVEVEVTARLRG